MDRLSTTPATDRIVSAPQRAPIFGLRYLEEETTEINSVVGCLYYDPQPGEGEPTYYTTGCDYTDAD